MPFSQLPCTTTITQSQFIHSDALHFRGAETPRRYTYLHMNPEFHLTALLLHIRQVTLKAPPPYIRTPSPTTQRSSARLREISRVTQYAKAPLAWPPTDKERRTSAEISLRTMDLEGANRLGGAHPCTRHELLSRRQKTRFREHAELEASGIGNWESGIG